MFYALLEDLSRAKVADHERLVARVLLERNARAALNAEIEANLCSHPRRLPWLQSWRPWRLAN